MNIIQFYPFSENTASFAESPKPASKYLPEWYRKQPGVVGLPEEQTAQGVVGPTIKKCMPIFDMLTAGYMITAPCDIYLDATNSEKLTYSVPPALRQFQGDLFASHSREQYSELPIDETKNHRDLLRIMPLWAIKTPPGYSAMFIHPQLSMDSPLWAFPGIIDTDSFIVDGHFSFLVDKTFKGVIKQGTPLVQVIPFKREDWSSWTGEEIASEVSSKALNTQRLKLRSNFVNAYKNKFRFKKEYK
jgi:hypothetical protein